MLQVNNLSFDYVDNPVLKNIDFELPAGKLMHLQGENGSGKSTLLKIIAGLISPTEGDIRYNDEPIEFIKSNYQRNLCYVGHKLGISPVLSAQENCHFDLQHGRRVIDWVRSVEQLSLTGLDQVPCGLLSAGQRRRVALLRLQMSNAKIWLLDEPFVSLDNQTILFLTEQLLNHLSHGGAVILTSHQSIPFPPDLYLEYCL